VRGADEEGGRKGDQLKRSWAVRQATKRGSDVHWDESKQMIRMR
jgi:hypothetical protein